MRRLIPLALVVALLVVACGGGSSALDPADSAAVAKFRLDVASTALDGSGYADLLDSMPEAIALARENPDATYEPSGEPKITMRQVLSDAASDLAPYQPDLAGQLDRAVQTLP